VIGPKEASRRAEEGNRLGLSYLYDLDKFTLQDEMQDELSIGMEAADHENHYTIDGRYCGAVTRFINHSCDPNLETYAVASDRRDGKGYPCVRRDVLLVYEHGSDCGRYETGR
jgi:histone-lysine N-methyltransferase SUV39H